MPIRFAVQEPLETLRRRLSTLGTHARVDQVAGNREKGTQRVQDAEEAEEESSSIRNR